MDEKINDVLGFLGLNKNEIEVYLCLVKRGSASPLDISKETKIHRSNVYDLLRNLMDKGFISESVKDGKKLFMALGPGKIEEYYSMKKKEIESALGQLKKFKPNFMNEEEVVLSRGVLSVRESLLELFHEKKDIHIYGFPDEFFEVVGFGFLEDFNKSRIVEGINLSVLSNGFKGVVLRRLNRKEFTHLRCLDDESESLVSMMICGEVVLIIVFEDIPTVIKIRSKEIAGMYLKYFKVLWENAREVV